MAYSRADIAMISGFLGLFTGLLIQLMAGGGCCCCKDINHFVRGGGRKGEGEREEEGEGGRS